MDGAFHKRKKIKLVKLPSAGKYLKFSLYLEKTAAELSVAGYILSLKLNISQGFMAFSSVLPTICLPRP